MFLFTILLKINPHPSVRKAGLNLWISRFFLPVRPLFVEIIGKRFPAKDVLRRFSQHHLVTVRARFPRNLYKSFFVLYKRDFLLYKFRFLFRHLFPEKGLFFHFIQHGNCQRNGNQERTEVGHCLTHLHTLQS